MSKQLNGVFIGTLYFCIMIAVFEFYNEILYIDFLPDESDGYEIKELEGMMRIDADNC